MQNHISCTFLKQTLPLPGREPSPLLHLPLNALASLTVNCSVLLLSVAPASSQTLAPRWLYHKGQKTVCVFVDG